MEIRELPEEFKVNYLQIQIIICKFKQLLKILQLIDKLRIDKTYNLIIGTSNQLNESIKLNEEDLDLFYKIAPQLLNKRKSKSFDSSSKITLNLSSHKITENDFIFCIWSIIDKQYEEFMKRTGLEW